MTAATVALYAAWPLAVAALFRSLGPIRATPAAVLSGFLVLPRVSPCGPLFGVLAIDARTASGLSLLLGLLVSDPRALLRGRPKLVDAPMAAFLLMPLAASMSNGNGQVAATIGQSWADALGWGVPYLLGRLYLGDRDAPRRLSIAVVIAGLCYAPACLFEIFAGPRYYLLGLVHGEGPHAHMVERLGGHRPEVFLTNGIELTSWMAMASTLAFWLWLRRGWSPGRLPSWVPALVLAAVTLACRGAYGYLTLALGLATAGLSHALRTRFLILGLTLVPPAYVVARDSGLWDGQVLARLADRAGSGGSVAYRLRAEDSYAKKTAEHGLALGFGGEDSAIFDYHARAHLWPDGWWVHQMRRVGLVGLAAFAAAFFLAPAWMALALPSGRTWRASPGSMAWGLALFLALHMVDSLQNMAYLTATPMIGGALGSLFLGRRLGRYDVAPGPPRAAGPAPNERIPLLITVVVLAAIEALGRSPGATGPAPEIKPPAASAPRPAGTGR